MEALLYGSVTFGQTVEGATPEAIDVRSPRGEGSWRGTQGAALGALPQGGAPGARETVRMDNRSEGRGVPWHQWVLRGIES